ncbi:benzoate/H(+) symporter BenE family transporter [Microbacterium nymphoidis]|uniref:benzoate/H(+) symporter BenE family transporter n=1 Tax=Microbacterium nymphoidis TaxID=2898586 RepID=UPI001E2C1F2A|nr:benzoate/H(+) symporter BenE family transporter [Microbacterium nymphoidis]MCD2499562.1 benzoate/H(+) symporter BenE family transporter [Microbacterium nymphoidis]
MSERTTKDTARPIVAGIVTALVGFTSSFVVVLTGLRAVGATDAQAASGLLALSVTMGIACILLSLRTRMPVTSAWSTPGAALLAGASAVDGGWPAAVGAFIVTGLLIVVTGVWPFLGALVTRIPAPLAQAMLAGVLLPLCVAPVTGAVTNPWGVLPVIAVWLLGLRFLPRWAVPLAFVTAAAVVVAGIVQSGAAVDPAALLPRLEFVTPAFSFGGIIGIAVPLFIVTMASQNIPGVAIMRSYGYEVPWRSAMITTGVGTILGAPAGGHAINLAAISAALAASDEAGKDPSRRWIAGVTTGVAYLVLGTASAVFAALVVFAPAGVIAAVAGLALLASFASAVHQAIIEPELRIPAAVTFIVAASGISPFGIAAAFWALLVGLVLHVVLRRR